MKVIENLKFAPVTIFMIYARLRGMTELAWKEAFILSGIATVVIVVLLLQRKVILDRLMLGANLFFLVGAVSFLCNINTILYYYGTYKGTSFLACVVFVGLVTTFFSQAGFIGIMHENKAKVQNTSIQLLGASIIGLIWSIIFNNSGIFISAAIPFILLKMFQDRMVKQFVK